MRLCSLILLAVLGPLHASALDAQPNGGIEELGLVAKRLAKLEAYGVRVAIRLSHVDDEATAQVMRVEAWRDGQQFAYRSGAVEVQWLTRAVIVVNHASRTILLRKPLRQEEGLADLAARLSHDHLTLNAASADVSVSQEANGRRFVVPYASGPLLRTEILLDAESDLPLSALLVYRPEPRAPKQVAIAYEWKLGKPSASILDHQRFLAWEEDIVVLQPSYSGYTLVRLDRVQ